MIVEMEVIILDIDKDQTYYIEAKLIGSNNIAEEKEKKMKVVIPSQTLGMIENIICKIGNSELVFEEIVSTKYNDINKEKYLSTEGENLKLQQKENTQIEEQKKIENKRIVNNESSENQIKNKVNNESQDLY